MAQILTYSPGQIATIFHEVLDGYGTRTNVLDGYGSLTIDGYTPVVARIITPALTQVAGYPQQMHKFDTGLYYFQYTIPTGATAVGTYVIDIVYKDALTTRVINKAYQVVVTAPFGIYGVTT